MKQAKQSKKSIPDKRVLKKPPVKKKDSGLLPFLLPAILIGISFFAFLPCTLNDFTTWDDPIYVVFNPLIKQLSGENIKRIFSEAYFFNYAPLHLFSYMIEYHFFGLKASGYHWVSLFMHIINVLLVMWIAKFISKNNTIAFFTALLFALTPMRVESVAWVSERKDLLYSIFFFAALLCYLFYVHKNLKKSYFILSLFLFVLSVFSKTMAVSLVPVLFLVDYFYSRKFTIKVVLEKIPFILISIVMGIISLKAQDKAIDPGNVFSYMDRIFFACHNLLMYAAKLIYPFGLTNYYSYPNLVNGHIPVIYYASGIVILLISIWVIWSQRKGKLIFFSTGYFFSTVALVLMIIPVGATIFSERYSYVPSVMLYFMLLFYLFGWIEKRNSKSWLIAASIGLVIYSLFFAQLTRQRCLVWKDTVTLWTDMIKKDKTSAHAYNNRGLEYFKLNEKRLAIADLRRAIELKPDFPEPYANLCEVYGSMNMLDSAYYFVNLALVIKPDMYQAINDRGILRAGSNHPDSAMADFNHAIQMKPDLAFGTYNNRGILYGNLGNPDSAIADFNRVLMINPDFTDAYKSKGMQLKLKNNFDEAILCLNTYLQKGGQDPKVYSEIGKCYAAKNDFVNAVKFARQAVDHGIPGAQQDIDNWSQHIK